MKYRVKIESVDDERFSNILDITVDVPDIYYGHSKDKGNLALGILYAVRDLIDGGDYKVE